MRRNRVNSDGIACVVRGVFLRSFAVRFFGTWQFAIDKTDAVVGICCGKMHWEKEIVGSSRARYRALESVVWFL